MMVRAPSTPTGFAVIPPAHTGVMGLGALIEAVDELVEGDLEALGEGDTVVELYRQRARLDAVIAAAAAAFDTDGAWAGDGARSGPAWVAVRTHHPRPRARRDARLGRRLRLLPEARRAWLAGEVALDHAGVLATLLEPATRAAAIRDESLLVGFATDLGFAEFVRAVEYWRLHADPDGAEDRDRDRHAARSVHLVASIGGCWLGQVTLDPIAGSIVAGELDAIATEFFRTDWAEAEARLGRRPTAHELARTPAQRRADALVEMATRSATAPPDGRRPAPLFTVLVGYETIKGTVCELAGGPVLAPGALAAWLDTAWLERVVFGPDSLPIDVGRSHRLFTAGATRGLRACYRTCFHEYCDVDSEHCQMDHVIPWAAQGPTDIANGRPACAFHNRARNGRPPPRRSG